VAHEVNNPLAAISGFAEGIKRRLPRLESSDQTALADVEDYVGTILKECRRCQDIVHTLLTFSRPRSSGFSPVNVNDVVEDTLKLLRSHVKQKGLRLAVRTDLSTDLPHIYADEPQLKQVLLNLLVNAMDAVDQMTQDGREGGVITIRTYPEENEGVGLVVSDTGCGIPKENLDKLFEPFFTTKPVGKGIGIGLSTCYAIVKEHQGEIRAFSEYRGGSRFVVKLPSNTDLK